MNELRMTKEEINELEPSFENQIELICDRITTSIHLNIKVISPVVYNCVCYLDAGGNPSSTINALAFLSRYPSFKKPPFEPKTVRVHLDITVETEDNLGALENLVRRGNIICDKCSLAELGKIKVLFGHNF